MSMGDGHTWCPDCDSGYENHERYCTNGNRCVKKKGSPLEYTEAIDPAWGLSSLTYQEVMRLEKEEAEEEAMSYPRRSATIDSAEASSTQIGGTHYSKMAIQPYEYCLRNNLGPCETNAISYLSRWRDKQVTLEGKIEDLEKAIHTIEILIEHTRKYGL